MNQLLGSRWLVYNVMQFFQRANNIDSCELRLSRPGCLLATANIRP